MENKSDSYSQVVSFSLLEKLIKPGEKNAALSAF
jgi:hypothetical protein